MPQAGQHSKNMLHYYPERCYRRKACFTHLKGPCRQQHILRELRPECAPVPELCGGVFAHVAVGDKLHVWVALLDGVEEGQVVASVVGLPTVLHAGWDRSDTNAFTTLPPHYDLSVCECTLMTSQRLYTMHWVENGRMVYAMHHPRNAGDASVLHTRCTHAGSITKMWRDTHLIADAYIGEAPGLRVAHGCPEGPPLGPSIPCDELYGVQRVLHQRLYLRGGHTLLVAQAVVDDPNRLRAQLLIQQHVLVQAQACMQSSFCQGFRMNMAYEAALNCSGPRWALCPAPHPAACTHTGPGLGAFYAIILRAQKKPIDSCSIAACNARAVAYAEVSLLWSAQPRTGACRLLTCCLWHCESCEAESKIGLCSNCMLEGKRLTVSAPVLPHAVPVAGALVKGPHSGLPEEAVRHRHPLHIAAARKAQEPVQAGTHASAHQALCKLVTCYVARWRSKGVTAETNASRH